MHRLTRRAWTFYRTHAPDFAILSDPFTAPAGTRVEIIDHADHDRRLVRAEIDGRPAWSYVFDSDLEHQQQEFSL